MAKTNRRNKFPILLKTALLFFAFSLIITEIALTYYALMMSNKNKTTFADIADSYSQSIALSLDSEKVNDVSSQIHTIYKESGVKLDEEDETKLEEYYALFDGIAEEQSYKDIRKFLQDSIKDNSLFIADAFMVYVDLEDDVAIYLIDSATDEDMAPIGHLEDTSGFDPNNERGFPAYENNYPEYGWLMTAGYPVKYNGETVAYALVDISMGTVRASQADSIVRLFAYLITSVIFLGSVGVILAYFMMIKPLRKIANAAKNYNSNDPIQTHEQFQNLKITTGDEIAVLSDAIKKMESDLNNRFIELSEMNKQLISSREKTKELSILANKDGLTGVQNKIAYNNEVTRINQDIKNKDKVEFAVSMIDLNYLKNTNDEFGHDAGDTILVKLSQLICNIFAHSPVYRVGGDEFVVISSGNDYKNIDKLVKEFKEKISESIHNGDIPSNERVSAAIGYSIYDPKVDKDVDDVFKRADKEMYNYKHEMKKEK